MNGHAQEDDSVVHQLDMAICNADAHPYDPRAGKNVATMAAELAQQHKLGPGESTASLIQEELSGHYAVRDQPQGTYNRSE